MIFFDRLKSSQIPIWENKHRIKFLSDFLSVIRAYFGVNVSDMIVYRGSPAELRETISRRASDAERMIFLAGISLTGSWSYAGLTEQINLLAELFNLDARQIDPNFVLDRINQAIGVYENDQNKSRFRTYWPFFWITRLVEWIAQFPVWLFGSIFHLDQEKVARSAIGRIVTIIFQASLWLFALVQGLAALSYLLDHFGLEIPILHWLRFK